MRVLILEDDIELAAQIGATLQSEHFAVDICHDGEEGYDAGLEEDYDAVILDPGLPTMDGFTVLRRWREKGKDMPVIILTGSRKEVADMKEGVRAGATNYLTKPVDLELLLSWLQGVVNSSGPNTSRPIIEIGPIRMDTHALKVSKDGVPIKLTPTEYRILRYLMVHNERPISADELVRHNFEGDSVKTANEIPVFISRLRTKLGKQFIETVFGYGYRFTLTHLEPKN